MFSAIVSLLLGILVQETLSLSREAFSLFCPQLELKLESFPLKQRFEEWNFSMVLETTGN